MPIDATARVRTSTSRIVDIPLPGSSTLRVALVDDGDVPALVISRGFGGADDFRRPHWAGDPLILPADVLPQLLDALRALDVDAAPTDDG